jgi:hypothetical protein
MYIPVVTLTPQSVLRDYVLLALHELGGSGLKGQVLAQMDKRFGTGFTADDRRPQPSNGEAKWENQSAWERNSMVRDGLLEPYVPGVSVRGRWTLTARGRLAASRLHSRESQTR